MIPVDLGILMLAAGYAALFRWAFRSLPREEWQFVAAVPQRKALDGRWDGLNLTYYGVWTATAVAIAVSAFVVLLGTVGVRPAAIGALAAVLLGVTVPAASLLARLIERKAHTFTVGGAAFLGFVFAPAAIALVNAVLGPYTGSLPPFATMAGLGIAYAVGEGTGRLACLSFGCCYGKPVDACHRTVAPLFARWGVRFDGATKKAAYERGLAATPLIPIQALTAVVCVGAGLVGAWLFLHAHAMAAFLVTVLVTQLWRAVSEELRADHRGGGGRWSVYQTLATSAAAYGLLLAWLLPGRTGIIPDVRAGVALLWHPGVILSLQALWLVIFLRTGRSRVTGSVISLHVHPDRI